MGDTAADGAASGAQSNRPLAKIRPQRSPSPSSPVDRRIKTVPIVSAGSSVGGSPRTSREPSPNRTGFKLQQTTTSRLSRSRKNSQELGRGYVSIPDTPSPAAIQRALAAAGPARSQSSPLTSEFPNDANKSQKSSRAPSVTRSIRVTSPPPALNPIKRETLDPPPTPSITVHQPTPKSATSFEDIEEEGEDLLSPGMRSPRNVQTPRLEAVQESVDPETPALSSADKQFITKVPTRQATIAETLEDKRSMISTESGNESAGGKSVQSATTERKKPLLQSRRSYSQMASGKGKITGDGTLRNTSVETEIVTSIPLNIGAPESRITSGKQDPNATLRGKPSTETIRPRKDKKKTVRKAPSIASTTGTSKADIFEAKVKSAVEEADSSDSGETFVYESNPPDPMPRRHHSRTPSMTSIASQGDYYRGRYRQDANPSLAGKKSMKFANSSKNMSNYPDDDVSAVSTPSSARPTPGSDSGRFPRHIGRHGRNPAHVSLFDSDAPFNTVVRSPRKATAGSFNRKASPRPHTPKSANFRGSLKVQQYGANYDLEADDERTPLIATVRSGRSRRRGFDGQEDDEYYYYPQRRGSLKWFGACICLGSLFSLLVALVVVSLLLCSRALQGVHLKNIENVLASDKQLIFDLRVQAINPNLVGIQITDMNLFVHARSSYVGSDKWWREHDPNDPIDDHDVSKQDNVDEGTDPIEADPHLMLLGQVSSFDAPLSFDASPWHHDTSSSIGEVRLDRPGNSTDIDKDRWETVLHHDFDLIVRGVLKYTLPISSRVRSAEISGKTLVRPAVLPEPTTPDPDIPDIPDEPRKGNGTGSGSGSDEARIQSNSRLRHGYWARPIRLAST